MISSVRCPKALDLAKGFHEVLTGKFNGEGIRKGIFVGLFGGPRDSWCASIVLYIMVASRTGASTVLGNHSAGGPEYPGGGLTCPCSGKVCFQFRQGWFLFRFFRRGTIRSTKTVAINGSQCIPHGLYLGWGKVSWGPNVASPHTRIWNEDGSGSGPFIGGQDGPSPCLIRLSKVRRWIWVHDGIV